MITRIDRDDPHAGRPVLHLGPPPGEARLVAIMLHGRGASAEDILGLAQQVNARDVMFLAPQAAGQTWYPYSFLAPIEQNEPYLTSALQLIGSPERRAMRILRPPSSTR